MTPPAFTMRVHVYHDSRDDGTRTLVSYTPFLRLGAPGASGHAGEVVYLQQGYVSGAGGDVYDVEDLPAGLAAALGGLTAQARHDVGFTTDRVQWYAGGGLGAGDVATARGEPWEASPVALPSSPTWKLAWLCKNGHDYQGTGMSRYGKGMRCVDCERARKATP